MARSDLDERRHAPTKADSDACPAIYLTERDVAERWRLSPKTLQNWRVAGRGPRFWKFGQAVRYRLDDVIAFEDAGGGRQSTSEG
jgi:hypothetical protein